MAAGILACRRAGASSPAGMTQPNFEPVDYFGGCGKVWAFFPGGRMPPSTSGRMPDATRDGGGRPLACRGAGASSPADITHRNFKGMDYFGGCGKVWGFGPGGRMPPSTSGRMPDATRDGGGRPPGLPWSRASSPAGMTQRNFKPVDYFGGCWKVWRFGPGGRMPPSTSGRMPDATRCGGGRPLACRGAGLPARRE